MELPDFQAAIQLFCPWRSRLLQSPQRTLATILPPETPEPLSSSTPGLAEYCGSEWPMDSRVLSVTLPSPSSYMRNISAPLMREPIPRPTHS